MILTSLWTLIRVCKFHEEAIQLWPVLWPINYDLVGWLACLLLSILTHSCTFNLYGVKTFQHTGVSWNYRHTEKCSAIWITSWKRKRVVLEIFHVLSGGVKIYFLVTTSNCSIEHKGLVKINLQFHLVSKIVSSVNQ